MLGAREPLGVGAAPDFSRAGRSRRGLRPARRRSRRLRQPQPQVFLHREPVDDDLDRVLLLLVELWRVLEDVLSPSTRAPAKPSWRGSRALRDSPFRSRRDWGEDREARALGTPIRSTISETDCPDHRPPADRAVRRPDAREKQPQVVVDLRGGADGRNADSGRRSSSIEIAGHSPSIESTSGFSIIPRNWRAEAESDSISALPSA